jgi:hypothetical protein
MIQGDASALTPLPPGIWHDAASTPCPRFGTSSTRLHSHCMRQLADVPCGGRTFGCNHNKILVIVVAPLYHSRGSTYGAVSFCSDRSIHRIHPKRRRTSINTPWMIHSRSHTSAGMIWCGYFLLAGIRRTCLGSR